MAHAYAMSLPHRYGDRYAVYPSTRVCPFCTEIQDAISHFACGWPRINTLIAPAKPPEWRSRRARRTPNPETPGIANSSNPHKPQAAHRGFVLRGLSDAKRHPKRLHEPGHALPPEVQGGQADVGPKPDEPEPRRIWNLPHLFQRHRVPKDGVASRSAMRIRCAGVLSCYDRVVCGDRDMLPTVCYARRDDAFPVTRAVSVFLITAGVHLDVA